MTAVLTRAAFDAQTSPLGFTDLLLEELEPFKDQLSWPLSLVPLGEMKECSDATTKMVVSPQAGRPAAVFICSTVSAPHLIARSAKLAETVRGLIGSELGAAIVRPMATGYLSGRSYVLLPYLAGFSSHKAVRFAQRLMIRKPLLDWLAQANAAAAAQHGTDLATRQRYFMALKHLRDQQLFDADIQIAIDRARARIESGQWTPRHTFDHNDLWLGNVMLASKSGLTGHHRYPFTIIDWPGANARGYGIYDLLRIAPQLKLSHAALRRELIRHSEALHCELEDTRGHLLAALGRLHQHLENFPEHRFVAQSQDCWTLLEKALSR